MESGSCEGRIPHSIRVLLSARTSDLEGYCVDVVLIAIPHGPPEINYDFEKYIEFWIAAGAGLTAGATV